MLEAPSLDARYGACQALAALRSHGAPAVEALRQALAHDDLWLRIKAAEALARIGEGPNSKIIMMPLEAGSLIGSVAGMAELFNKDGKGSKS